MEPVAIFQIPTDVLAILDSLGKTVKVGYNGYSYDVSTCVSPKFSLFYFILGRKKDQYFDLIILAYG